MREKTRFWFKFLALAFLLNAFMLLTFSWFIAYYSSDKEVLIGINTYGEARLELLYMLFAIPVVIIGLLLILRDLAKSTNMVF